MTGPWLDGGLVHQYGIEWYWRTAPDDTEVFSSRHAALVSLDHADYVAWTESFNSAVIIISYEWLLEYYNTHVFFAPNHADVVAALELIVAGTREGKGSKSKYKNENGFWPPEAFGLEPIKVVDRVEDSKPPDGYKPLSERILDGPPVVPPEAEDVIKPSDQESGRVGDVK